MGDFFKVLGLQAFAATDIPPGIIIYSAVNSIGGYLLCDGSAVSRTTYTDLFTLIGTTYGSGDGSQTFNLPDFRDTILKGASATTDTLGTTTGANSITIDESSYTTHTHNISIDSHTHTFQPIYDVVDDQEYYMFNDDFSVTNNSVKSHELSDDLQDGTIAVESLHSNVAQNQYWAGSLVALTAEDGNEELHTLPNYTAGTYGNDNGSVDISLDTQGAGTSFSYDIVPEFENIYILVKY
jgi:microcystin-dependent protein